jgi:hypothetical protein
MDMSMIGDPFVRHLANDERSEIAQQNRKQFDRRFKIRFVNHFGHSMDVSRARSECDTSSAMS